MYRHVPNQITLVRLLLAAVFFVVLNQYRYGAGPDWAIIAAGVIFVVATFTDWLDGYLARKWNVESAFGRIMDPFCDKVLVLGAFIYLSGPRFVDPAAVKADAFFTMISGVYPWMVVVMLARELLVTGIRDEMETSGVKFGANLSGKLKMGLQSATVPLVLLFVLLDPNVAGREWLATARDVLVYATVLVTVLSGIPYVLASLKAIGLRH